jgi:hypothetical protein
MFIKLLCVNTVDLYDYYGDKLFTIQEGDAVNAMIQRNCIIFEYKKNHYSPAYNLETVSNDFISAFDEDAYNRIYQNVKDVTMHFKDGSTINLGDGIAKIR